MTQAALDVPKLAHSYRRLVLWFGAQLVLGIVVQPLAAIGRPGAGTALLSLVFLAGVLATIVALAVYAYRTSSALGSSVPVLWAVALLVPCLNVVSLLVLSARATRACRASGIPVGFLGPKVSAVPPASDTMRPS